MTLPLSRTRPISSSNQSDAFRNDYYSLKSTFWSNLSFLGRETRGCDENQEMLYESFFTHVIHTYRYGTQCANLVQPVLSRLSCKDQLPWKYTRQFLFIEDFLQKALPIYYRLRTSHDKAIRLRKCSTVITASVPYTRISPIRNKTTGIRDAWTIKKRNTSRKIVYTLVLQRGILSSASAFQFHGYKFS